MGPPELVESVPVHGRRWNQTYFKIHSNPSQSMMKTSGVLTWFYFPVEMEEVQRVTGLAGEQVSPHIPTRASQRDTTPSNYSHLR